MIPLNNNNNNDSNYNFDLSNFHELFNALDPNTLDEILNDLNFPTENPSEIEQNPNELQISANQEPQFFEVTSQPQAHISTINIPLRAEKQITLSSQAQLFLPQRISEDSNQKTDPQETTKHILFKPNYISIEFDVLNDDYICSIDYITSGIKNTSFSLNKSLNKLIDWAEGKAVLYDYNLIFIRLFDLKKTENNTHLGLDTPLNKHLFGIVLSLDIFNPKKQANHPTLLKMREFILAFIRLHPKTVIQLINSYPVENFKNKLMGLASLVYCLSENKNVKFINLLPEFKPSIVFSLLLCFELMLKKSKATNNAENLNPENLNLYENLIEDCKKLFLKDSLNDNLALEFISNEKLSILLDHWNKETGSSDMDFNKKIMIFALNSINTNPLAAQIISLFNKEGNLDSKSPISLLKKEIEIDINFRLKLISLTKSKITGKFANPTIKQKATYRLNIFLSFLDSCQNPGYEKIALELLKKMKQKIAKKWPLNTSYDYTWIDQLSDARGVWSFNPYKDDKYTESNIIKFLGVFISLLNAKRILTINLNKQHIEILSDLTEQFLNYLKPINILEIPPIFEGINAPTSEEIERTKNNILELGSEYEEQRKYINFFVYKHFFAKPHKIHFPIEQLLDLEVSKQIARSFFNEKIKLLDNPNNFKKNSITPTLITKPCFFLFEKNNQQYLRPLTSIYEGNNLIAILKDSKQESFNLCMKLLKTTNENFNPNDIANGCIPVTTQQINLLNTSDNSNYLFLNEIKVRKKDSKEKVHNDKNDPISLGSDTYKKGEVRAKVNQLLKMIDLSWNDKNDPLLRQELVYQTKASLCVFGISPILLSEQAQQKFYKPFYQALKHTSQNAKEKNLTISIIELLLQRLQSPTILQNQQLDATQKLKISEGQRDYPQLKSRCLNSFVNFDSKFDQAMIIRFLESCASVHMYRHIPVAVNDQLSIEDSQRYAYTLFKNSEECFKIRSPYLITKNPIAGETSLIPCLIIDQDADKVFIKIVNANRTPENNVYAFTKFKPESNFKDLLSDFKTTLSSENTLKLELNDLEKFIEKLVVSQFKFIVMPYHNANFDLRNRPVATGPLQDNPEQIEEEVNSIEDSSITEINDEDQHIDVDLTGENPVERPAKKRKLNNQEAIDLMELDESTRHRRRTTSANHEGLTNTNPDYRAIGKHNLKGFATISSQKPGQENANPGNILPPPAAAKFQLDFSQSELNPETFWEDLQTRTLETLKAKVSNEKMRKIALDLKTEIMPLKFPICAKLSQIEKAVPKSIGVLNPLLKNYQRKDFKRLYNLIVNGVSSILSPEMGLGKTFVYSELIAQKILHGHSGIHLVLAPQVAVDGIYQQLLTAFGETVTNVWSTIVAKKNEHKLNAVLTLYRDKKKLSSINDPFEELYLDFQSGAIHSQSPNLDGLRTVLRVYSKIPPDLRKRIKGTQFYTIRNKSNDMLICLKAHLNALKKNANNESKTAQLKNTLYTLLSKFTLNTPELKLSTFPGKNCSWSEEWNDRLNQILIKTNENLSEAIPLIVQMYKDFSEQRILSLFNKENPEFPDFFLLTLGRIINVNPDTKPEGLFLENTQGILDSMRFQFTMIQSFAASSNITGNLPWPQFTPGENRIVIASYPAGEKLTDPDDSRGRGWTKVLPYVQTIIADEAQNFHTVGTQSAKRMNDLIGTARKANPICWTSFVTGTPIENNDAELWSLLSSSNPNDFDQATHNALAEQKSKAVIAIQKSDLNITRKSVVRSFIHWRVFGEIADKLIIWRKRDLEVKNDWEGRVPDRRDETIIIQLNEITRNALKDLEKTFELSSNPIMVTNQVQKIQATLLHPKIKKDASVNVQSIDNQIRTIYRNINQFKEESAMVSALLNSKELRDEIIAKQERAIVFVDLNGVGTTVQKAIRDEFDDKVECTFYNGSLEENRRAELIGKFKDPNNNGKARVLILSMDAGGVGINLPEAMYGFSLMKDFNKFKEDQTYARMDRVNSIGPRVIIHFDFQTQYNNEWKTIRSFKHVEVVNSQKELLKEFLIQAKNPNLKAHFTLWLDYLKTIVHQSALNNMNDLDDIKNHLRAVDDRINVLKEEIEEDMLKSLIELAKPEEM